MYIYKYTYVYIYSCLEYKYLVHIGEKNHISIRVFFQDENLIYSRLEAKYTEGQRLLSCSAT